MKNITYKNNVKCCFTATVMLLHVDVALANEIPAIDCMIEPNVLVDLSSSVAGVLDTLTVDKSDEVKKGQIIATLKSDIEQVEVRSSKERLKLSAAEYKRAAALYREKAITRSEKEQSDNDNKLAELELKHAKTNLNLRQIKSPIDGVVVRRYANPGEFVETKPILQLAQLNPLRIEVVSPVANYGKIVKGMQATISPEFGDYKNLVAKVVVVDKVIDAASGTFSIRLELDNKNHAIPGGLKCSAKFMSDSLTEAKIEKLPIKKSPIKKVAAIATKSILEPTLEVNSNKNPTTAPNPTTSFATSSEDYLLCTTIGPYNKKRDVTSLLSTLRKEVKRSDIREKIAARKTYLVTSRLKKSSAEANLLKNEMQQAGFADIALLLKSKNKQLALGVYSSKVAAVRRIQSFKKKGFEVALTERRGKGKAKTYTADITYLSTSEEKISKHIPDMLQRACDDST